jgi:hypothetical protein
MIDSRFRPHIKHEYPINNKIIFEEWFYKRYNPVDNKSGREYVDVFPTSYAVNSSYGRESRKMRDLQSAINNIDKRKKYFMVCQYDSGPMVDLNGIDIVVCGMGGGRIDVPLPLTCQPHPYTFNVERNVFASFLGGMTHDIRREMMNATKNNARYQVSERKTPINDYCELMSKSIFALCPRGYGESSFRICEALQYGSIPVYISDKFIIPFNHDFNEYGIIIKQDQINDLDRILSEINLCDLYKKQQAGKKVYKEMFTYEGCYQNLIKNL